MNYLNYKQARDAAWEMLMDCNVTELPVDVVKICRHYGWRITNYRSGWKAIEALGLTELTKQTDGFCVYSGGNYYIFYDDSKPKPRQRFTIAHEIGHIMLGHIGDRQCTRINREPSAEDAPEETQANQFAARILAPAWVLHSIHALTPAEIADVCEISMTSATFRSERMRVLEERGRYLSHPLERQVAEQFRSFVDRVRRE